MAFSGQLVPFDGALQFIVFWGVGLRDNNNDEI